MVRAPGRVLRGPAAVYTRHRLSGRPSVWTSTSGSRDVYGRLLAYVYLGNELFNRTLVARGFATDDAVPPDTRMAATFAAAEADARSAGRGLWSACPNP